MCVFLHSQTEYSESKTIDTAIKNVILRVKYIWELGMKH